MDHRLYYAGKKAVFQFLDFAGDVCRAIVRGNRAVGLEDDGSFVVVFVDVVDGDAGFAFRCSANGFMYPHAVHPLSPVQGE
jgi:hypothetical protein